MKKVKLTHEEIEIIKMALQYVFERKVSIVSKNRKILGEAERANILEEANKIYNTKDVFDR